MADASWIDSAFETLFEQFPVFYLLDFRKSNVSPFAMENVDIYVIDALLWLKTNNAALNQGKNQRCYEATNAYV